MGVLSAAPAVALILLAAVILTGTATAQDRTFEYELKAVFLFNFAKYTEWPKSASEGPLTICVAAPSPFGSQLENTVRNETVNKRPLRARVVDKPDRACHLVFVPGGVGAAPYLADARDLPVLTVGEADDFIQRGGIVRFTMENNRVRFVIDQAAAKRAELRISSHVLKLARPDVAEAK